MNKKIYAALLSAFVSIPAFADMGNIYASGKIGWAWMELTDVYNSSSVPPLFTSSEPFNSGNDQSVLAYGGAIGYQWNAFLIPVRMEVDYTYRNKLDYDTNFEYTNDDASLSTTVQSQTLLGNFYLDLPLVQMFGLFVGGGLGVAFNTTENSLNVADGTYFTDNSTDQFDLAWMVTAGMSFTPLEWMAVDLSYRYSDLGNVLWSTPIYAEFSSDHFTSQDLFLTFRFTMPSAPRPPAMAPVPYTPKAQPEPAPIPVTKSPAYQKPATKSPSYDAERARRIKKNGILSKDK